jgi:hypothetical protein
MPPPFSQQGCPCLEQRLLLPRKAAPADPATNFLHHQPQQCRPPIPSRGALVLSNFYLCSSIVLLYYFTTSRSKNLFHLSSLCFHSFIFFSSAYFLNHFSLSAFSLIPDYLSKTVLIKNLENRFLFAGELYL